MTVGGLATVGCLAAILNTVAVALFPDSLLSGCVAVCQDPRRFITRLNDRRYLWFCCRLTITSNKYWYLPSEYAPSTDLARKSPEKAQNDGGLCDPLG